MVKTTYRELAFGSFIIGILGLSIALPGYLRDWNEYKVCQQKYVCVHEPYLIDGPQPAKLEPVAVHIGQPLIKVLGIVFACVGFPVAAAAAREVAESAEFYESSEAIEKMATLQFQMQKHSIDNRVSADGYEAMKAIETADLVDQFRETFFTPVTVDDIEAQMESEQRKLEQSREYKRLEFEVEGEQPKQDLPAMNRSWSQAAQNFYGWLMERLGSGLPEVINSEWISTQDFDGRKLKPEHWLPLVKELVAEELVVWVEEGKSFRVL